MCYQGDRPWCGPTCIVMVLQYWNINVSVDEAGQVIDPEMDGCHTYELVRYLEGFDVNIYEFNSIEELQIWIRRNHPVVVLQWASEAKKVGHYRVVIGFDANYVYLNDPNGFEDRMSYELFFMLWTKHDQYALTISPLVSFIVPVKNRSVYIGGE